MLLLVPLARGVPRGAVRRHERDERDDAAAVEETSELSYSTYRLVAVGRREAEVSVESRAHVVAVELLHDFAVLQHQSLLQRSSYGRLTTPRQTRHPQRNTFLLDRLEASLFRQVAGLLGRSRSGLGALYYIWWRSC